jgi:hypothetical protein
LRLKGQHYRDMCRIVDDRVELDLAGPAAKHLLYEPGPD